MSIVARPYEPADAEGYFLVRAATYENGVIPAPEDREIGGGRAFVCDVDGRVAGVAKMIEYVCSRNEAEIPMGGIAGVAVSPAERRSGVGSNLLAWLVRYQKEQGFPLSSLYAFREPFYRKFGYEVCGKRIHIVCPTSRLPKLQSDLPVRYLSPTEWRQIRPCYDDFAHARSGMHIRPELRWNDRVTAKDSPAIYAFGDPVEAYVIVVHKINFWESQVVAEVAWRTEAGYRALIAWFGGLGANKTHIDWSEPSDSPFVAQFMDQGVEVRVDRQVMYRVTDVPAALSLLRPTGTGEFTIEVRDDLIAENLGPWRVAFSPDGVAVERASKADLSLDIRQFATAFMGDPSILDLARNQLVQVRDGKALAAAAALLTPTPVCCWDFF